MTSPEKTNGSRGEWIWFAPFAGATLLAMLVAQTIAIQHDHDMTAMLGQYLGQSLTLVPGVLMLWLAVRLTQLLLTRDPRPLASAAAMAGGVMRRPADAAIQLGTLVVMPMMATALTALKILLPLTRGDFVADPIFARIDRLLFLGQDPWRITHALLGTQLPTMLIDRLYTAWVPLLAGAIAYYALFARPADRARFFLTFSACWIVLGTVMAWFGASAGPCFQEVLGAPDAASFAGLMKQLTMIDSVVGLSAVRWQAVLWDAHAAGRMQFAMGISAMPSMHVSVATLYVLLARRHGRLAFRVALGFAAVTFIGSIHLGWHYASDGLVSIGGTILLWRAVDRWLVRREERAAPVAQVGSEPAVV